MQIHEIKILFSTNQVEKEFVLRNANQEVLSPTRKIKASNIEDGDVVYLGLKGL